MKCLLSSILLLFFLISPAQAIVTYNVEYLTGGNVRALDYISVNDLNNGDRAIAVYRSGVSDYYLYFKYDASGVTAEQTAAHPYYIRPNDYVASGVWVEVPPRWLDIGSSLTITDLTVTGTNTVTNLDASGRLSGKIPITDMVSGTYTLSGISLYGGIAHNYGATAAVTAYVLDCTKGMSAVIDLARDMTNGGTVWVTFATGQKIANYPSFKAGNAAGTSYYYLSGSATSGVTGEGISLIAIADNVWYVYTDGSPTVGSR